MTRRQPTAEIKLILVAATIVTVLAVAATVLLLSPEEKVNDSEISFKAVEALDVVRVYIVNAADSIDIAFNGEGYRVDDVPADVVDARRLIDLLNTCGTVTALRMVTPAPQDLDAYGLAEPAAKVEITYADQGRLTLMIGNKERVTGDTYFSVKGNPAVYLMASERSAGFLLPKKAFVDVRVTPELVLSSPLSALLDITFVGGPLPEPITIEAVATKNPAVVRAALSFGAATHIVRGTGIYELDQTYAVEKMGPLLGITADDIIAYGLTPQEIMEFGFNRPTMQVAFDLKNGIDVDVESYVLAVLAKDSKFYMTCNDNGVIYAVPEPAFLQLEYSKLLVRWFMAPLLPDVRAIELTTEGNDYEFVISGETNSEKRAKLNGEELDIGRFRTLFGLLTSAAHDGRLLEDIVVEGDPLLRLTYHYLDTQKSPDIVELFPGDARRHYVRVNGVTELAMPVTYLARVQEALSILRTDAPIETDW